MKTRPDQNLAQAIAEATRERDEAQAAYVAARDAHRASGSFVEPASVGKARARYLLAQSECSRVRASAYAGNASNGLPRGCEVAPWPPKREISGMATKNFSATHYKGKPAVYDSRSRVYYYGYKTMREAREKAAALNEGK